MVTMKAAIISIFVMSLVLGLILSQNEAYAANQGQSQKTLNVTVYLNGAPAAKATCSAVTNIDPTPVSATTNNMGKASFSLPSSASTAYISCSLHGHNASVTVTLSSGTTTNTQLFLS